MGFFSLFFISNAATTATVAAIYNKKKSYIKANKCVPKRGETGEKKRERRRRKKKQLFKCK